MKKRFIYILLIVFLTITFGPQNVLGQDVLDQSISTNKILNDKMDFFNAASYSLEHNNNIRAMRNGLSATERDIGIARSDMLPKVKFQENFTVTNNPIEAFAIKLNQTRATPGDLSFGTLDYPGATTNFLTSGIIEQKIIDRKSMLAIKMAKKGYSENAYLFLRMQEELVNQVAQAYLSVNANEELINISKQAIDDTKRHLATAEDRYKRKVGIYSDVLRAKSALAEHEEGLISAQRNWEVSKRNLGLLLGLQTPIDTSNSVPEMTLQDINYYKNFAAYRNDLKAMEIKVENAKNNIQSAQAAWYPTLAAVASYNFYNQSYPFGGQGNNYIAGAFFKWDVFDGNRRKYEILKAKDKKAEAEEYLEGLKKTIDFKIYEAYSKVEENRRNLELAIEAEKEAEKDTVLVEQRWKNSELLLPSLVDAQINLNETRTNVIKLKKGVKESLINLTYESGIIMQELSLR